MDKSTNCILRRILFGLLPIVLANVVWANSYILNFDGVDIRNFIDAVSKNLNKTFIVDKNVTGTVDVHSHEPLDEKEYFVFFEYILTTHGYSLVKLDQKTYKVIPSQMTKTEGVPVIPENVKTFGDSVVTKVVKVSNVTVEALTPILRQLINEAGSGNISHHAASNTITLTGRGSVVNRIETIVHQIDLAGNEVMATVSLKNAKSIKIAEVINALNSGRNNAGREGRITPTLVADERTNTILIVADAFMLNRIKNIIAILDKKIEMKNDTKVFYLQFAKAEEVAKVLEGVSASMEEEENPVGVSSQQAIVNADVASNSVVIIASAERMRALEQVVNQLDIRRAQVLIEAMIVEITENDSLQYGVQWSNNRSAILQFSGNGASVSSVLLAKKRTDKAIAINEVAGSIRGLMAGVAFGDWNMLASALSGVTRSNILAAPSLMVLDNEEASFVVGEEVPVKTGEQINGDFKNAFATIERKDVGIKLTIRPQINQGRMVQMNLQQEISNVIGANGAVDVRFGKRQLNTSVMAADQQMIVLSGLIDHRNAHTVSKLPILGDLPLLGEAFKETIKSNEKRHLMLFIKPTIIRSDGLATEASQRKYAQIRGKQRALSGVDNDIQEIPPYDEMLNFPPEVQVIQQQLGDF